VDGLVEPGVRVLAQRLYLADVAAVVGIIVEKPSIYPVIALVLGMFSFYIFVGSVACKPQTVEISCVC
jgi:hypothetical protein